MCGCQEEAMCSKAIGQYVTVAESSTDGLGDEGVVTICEAEVWGTRMDAASHGGGH